MVDMTHSNPINICDKIKSTCNYVYLNSTHVKINDEKINKFIDEKLNLFEAVPSWASCHFNPNDFDLESTIAFVFVIDSLNFCFWPYENSENFKPENDFEYGNLVNNTLKTLKEEPTFFSPSNLSILTVDKLKEKIFNNEWFPLLEERTRSLNELGYYIKSEFASFKNFVESNEYDCVKIVNSIARGVTTYRDETIYKGKQIAIFKRAQILAADLFYMFRELNEPIILKNSDALTMFADYRVPQILLDLGIMEYDQDLLNDILNKKEILPNTLQEIEIRANTIISVEKIKNKINEKGILKKNILSLEVDYVLWNVGEERRKDLKPHHRTLTIFY